MTTVAEPITTAKPPLEFKPFEKKPPASADILEAAADYIDDHGWCQRAARDEIGRVCAAGAIYSVMYPDEWSVTPHSRWRRVDDVCREAQTALGDHEDHYVTHVVSLNDAALTTKDDVTSYLRRAAKALRS